MIGAGEYGCPQQTEESHLYLLFVVASSETTFNMRVLTSDGLVTSKAPRPQGGTSRQGIV